MAKPKLLLAILITACAWLQLSGCSLIGLGLGSLADAASPDEYIFTPAGVDSIRHGSTIEVTKTDSTTTSGDFERLDAAPSEEYSVNYKASMNSLPIGQLMPALGDSILIVTHGVSGRKTFTGKLLGSYQEMIRVNLSGGKAPVGVLVEAVDTLSHDATIAVPGDVLRHHLNNGDIPCMNALVITNEQGTKRMLVTDILKVRQPVSKDLALIAFAIGAAIDVAVLIAFVRYL